MNHPPYHLRPNKAIDRFLLIEILDRLKKNCEISDYTYYGFGGPFLEDCRLIYNRYPEIKIVSIENDKQTFKRQNFHRFSKDLDLKHQEFADFLANFSSNGGEIFWLDYTNLRFGHFEDFKNVLGKVSENSIVKITIRANPYNKNLENFQQEFEGIVPRSTVPKDIKRPPLFIKLLQKMLKIASQQALPASGESVFQHLNSSHYSDRTQMLSITGIVCNKNKVLKIRRWFKDWEFINLEWKDPHKIDVPTLSIKERLHLERHIPTPDKMGQTLSDILEYKIDEDEKHIEKLKQYEEFHQYYPYFARVSF